MAKKKTKNDITKKFIKKLRQQLEKDLRREEYSKLYFEYGTLYFKEMLKRLEETPKPLQPISIRDQTPYYTSGTLPKLEIFDALLSIMQDKSKVLEHRVLKPVIEFHIKHLSLINERKALNEDYEFFLKAFQEINVKLNDLIEKNTKVVLDPNRGTTDVFIVRRKQDYESFVKNFHTINPIIQERLNPDDYKSSLKRFEKMHLQSMQERLNPDDYKSFLEMLQEVKLKVNNPIKENTQEMLDPDLLHREIPKDEVQC